ncbi:MAG: hypothetical protein AB7M05_20900 [Alphaproteobacteria bacterium]
MKIPCSLEEWYWISQIVLTGIVFVTAIGAICQLRMLSRQSRATFLMGLDTRWESEHLTVARKTILEYREKVREIIRLEHSEKSQKEKQEIYKNLFKTLLSDLKKEKRDDWECFMTLGRFFESLGHLTKNKYLKVEEVDSLLGYSVLQFEDMCAAHIQEWEREENAKMGIQTELFKNALELARSIRAISKSADGPAAGHN